MTRKMALARALELYECAPGERITGTTRRWVELSEDPSVPGPVRDVLCWVVEFSGDDGPTADLYIGDATGELVKRSTYT